MAVSQVGSLVSFSSGTTAVSADVNSNFSAIRTQFNALVTGSDQLVGGLNVNGALYINDTANGNVTIGLTINQGSNDDHILAFKSSDVGHGLTTVAETDTYACFRKYSGSAGGLKMVAVTDDGPDSVGLWVETYTGTANTTKSQSGFGAVHFYAAEHDGSGTIESFSANGNVFGMSVKDGVQQRTVFLVDEDGDFHYDGADGGAFDSEDDLALVRTFALATSKQVIRTEFDEFLRYNEADLVRFGILGDTVENGGLVNGAQLMRLVVGAIGQVGRRLQAIEQKTLPA